MMLTYLLYGLTVTSAYHLDAESCSCGSPEITIRDEPFELPEMQRTLTGMLCHVSQDTVWLHWDNIGSFRIRAGSEITAAPVTHGDRRLFLHTLTGSVMAIALYQRGCFILHASAVVVHGQAVVFSGDSGYGKSTLASNLHACGYGLLADDIGVIQLGEDRHKVLPGNQELKLWPDSVRKIGGREDSLPRVFPNQEKRLFPISERLRRDPVPLQSIYILDFGENAATERLSQAHAAIEIVRNAFGVTLLHDLRTEGFFQQAVALAQSVPVYRLQRGRSLDDFDQFLDMVHESIILDHPH